MIDLTVILFILLIHWLADFCLQTDEQAKEKCKSLTMLGYHVGTYSLCWLFGSYALLGNWTLAFFFTVVTCVCHFCTDYVTSRLSKPFWDKGDTHNGFIIVGFDQVLHYVQLFLTYLWLT